MSGSDGINALVVAQRVLTQPSRFRVTDNEVIAMAGCLVGLDQQIEVLETGPTTNARLAAALASFIQKEAAMTSAKAPDGYVPLPAIAARYEAFNTLKTIFETEFPNV
jgi:hypothetical protein